MGSATVRASPAIAVASISKAAAGSVLSWLAVLSSALALAPVLPLMVLLPKFQGVSPYMALRAVTCVRVRSLVDSCHSTGYRVKLSAR